MRYFTVVSLILQSPFTLGNVISHPNHHEIKMFPFNVIKDNDNIPTEKRACILICINAASPTGNTPPCPLHHNVQCCVAPSNKKPFVVRLPLAPHPSPQHPTPFWGSSCFRASGGLVWLLTAQVRLVLRSPDCFLPEDFCSACFPTVLIAKQREIIGWLNIHSFIRYWWQLFPPSPVIFKGRAGTLHSVVKGTMGGDWFVRL